MLDDGVGEMAIMINYVAVSSSEHGTVGTVRTQSTEQLSY